MNRAELARQAWAILLSNPNFSHESSVSQIAERSVVAADELLRCLNITPETVAESQQVSAGIVQPAYMYRFRGPEMSGFTRGKLYNATTDDDTVYCLDDNGVSRFRPIREFERVDNA